jgi:hypothetical protein
LGFCGGLWAHFKCSNSNNNNISIQTNTNTQTQAEIPETNKNN